jgi:hypothetical protein
MGDLAGLLIGVGFLVVLGAYIGVGFRVVLGAYIAVSAPILARGDEPDAQTARRP